MSRRQISQTPVAQQARERRLMAAIKKQERVMYAEVGAFMAKGMSFDEAWIAAGGQIIPLKVEAQK